MPPPTLVLDATMYPHIIDCVLRCSCRESLLQWRRVSDDLRRRADAVLAGDHLIITPAGNGKTIVSAPHGRLPAFWEWEDLHQSPLFCRYRFIEEPPVPDWHMFAGDQLAEIYCWDHGLVMDSDDAEFYNYAGSCDGLDHEISWTVPDRREMFELRHVRVVDLVGFGGVPESVADFLNFIPDYTLRFLGLSGDFPKIEEYRSTPQPEMPPKTTAVFEDLPSLFGWEGGDRLPDWGRNSSGDPRQEEIVINIAFTPVNDRYPTFEEGPGGFKLWALAKRVVWVFHPAEQPEADAGDPESIDRRFNRNHMLNRIIEASAELLDAGVGVTVVGLECLISDHEFDLFKAKDKRAKFRTVLKKYFCGRRIDGEHLLQDVEFFTLAKYRANIGQERAVVKTSRSMAVPPVVTAKKAAPKKAAPKKAAPKKAAPRQAAAKDVADK